MSEASVETLRRVMSQSLTHILLNQSVHGTNQVSLSKFYHKLHHSINFQTPPSMHTNASEKTNPSTIHPSLTNTHMGKSSALTHSGNVDKLLWRG